jgi:hypothetical protein
MSPRLNENGGAAASFLRTKVGEVGVGPADSAQTQAQVARAGQRNRTGFGRGCKQRYVGFVLESVAEAQGTRSAGGKFASGGVQRSVSDFFTKRGIDDCNFDLECDNVGVRQAKLATFVESLRGFGEQNLLGVGKSRVDKARIAEQGSPNLLIELRIVWIDSTDLFYTYFLGGTKRRKLQVAMGASAG